MKFEPPTIAESIAFGQEIGLPPRECERWWYFQDSRDWLLNRVKIKRWKSALQVWRLKWLENQSPVRPSGATAVIYGKELERVIARIQTLRSQYSDHQTFDVKDMQELKTLKARRDELKKQLGVTF